MQDLLKAKSGDKNFNSLGDEELDMLIEDSEQIQKWKQIPKAYREKLTKKQLVKMFKESTMADSIQVTVQQSKKQKLTKRVFANDDPDELKLILNRPSSHQL